MWVFLAGRDHIIFFSGDWGVCEFFPQSPPDLQNMIHLTFWGLKTQRRGLYLDRGPCYNPDKDIVLPPIQVLQAIRLSSSFYSVGAFGRVRPRERSMLTCQCVPEEPHHRRCQLLLLRSSI